MPLPNGNGAGYTRPRRPEYSYTGGVQGLGNFYARVGSNAGYDLLQVNDPNPSSPQDTQVTYPVVFQGLIGWGPIRIEDLVVTADYQYTQDWEVTGEQALAFTNGFANSTWMGENFLFQTSSLTRTHQFDLDVRYVLGHYQLGLLSRVAFSRQGSSLFGAPQEISETSDEVENFVPYLTYQWHNLYRLQVSVPFRTEMNKIDPRLSNATYLYNTAKGSATFPYFSFRVNNAYYIEQIDAILYGDVIWNNFRYSSILNDTEQHGFAVSIDFPLRWGIRVQPEFTYFTQSFDVPRVRIPHDPLADPGTTPAKATTRADTNQDVGVYAYWDLSRSFRLTAEFAQLSTASNVREFTQSQTLYRFGVSYSWPNSLFVERRVDRFKDNEFFARVF